MILKIYHLIHIVRWNISIKNIFSHKLVLFDCFAIQLVQERQDKFLILSFYLLSFAIISAPIISCGFTIFYFSSYFCLIYYEFTDFYIYIQYVSIS